MHKLKAGRMQCTKPSMWILNVGHSIPEDSRFNYSTHVIKLYEEALPVRIMSKLPLVSSKRPSISFQCTAIHYSEDWPLTCYTELDFDTGKAQAINPIEIELNTMQCPNLMDIVIIY
jgi:hypothetical protein